MSVHPTLRYADPDAAIALLRDAVGFTVTSDDRDDDGTVVHAELVHGGGAVLIGPRREGDTFATGRVVVYCVVDDPDAHHARRSPPAPPWSRSSSTSRTAPASGPPWTARTTSGASAPTAPASS